MRTYGQLCPVAQAAEVIAERWTPLVIRELLSGSRRFDDLQRGVPLTSSALLSERLKGSSGAASSSGVRFSAGALASTASPGRGRN